MNNSPILFRKLTKADWLVFRKLEEEAFANDEISEEEFNRLTSNDGFIGFFSKNQPDELVGYLYLTLYSNYAHLNRIGVKKEKRGLGYGNILMEHAIKYFSEFNPKNIGIYVETHNNTAISLYKKYGFKEQFQSWHYIIDLNSFDKEILPELNLDDYSLKEINVEDLLEISKIFSDMNFTEMKGSLESFKNIKDARLKFLGLLKNNEFVGFARFNPNFSGCRPFHYTSLKNVDPFIELIKHYKLSDKDYIRITFDKYEELSELFAKRNYKKHHHLYKLVKQMSDL